MGSSVAPKQFGMPGVYGQSQGGNNIQQAQAAPQIQGPQLDPLNPPTPAPAQAQPQPAQPQDQQDPNAIYQRRYGNSFYGGNRYQMMDY